MILTAGFDYKNSPIEVREKFSFTSKKLYRLYEQIKNDGIIDEAIILSTCNRSEIYASCDDSGIDYLKNLFSDEGLIIRKDIDAIEHCFRVASGLESMVIGEDQILGQVKTAYENAVNCGCSSKILNRLFLESITTAKKIKTYTNLSAGNLSVASIAIKLLEKEFGDLSGKNALMLGFGKINKIILEHLDKKNLNDIYTINRTSVGINFKARYNYINKADFVISCTSAPHFIITEERFKEVYAGNKPLFIVDLAVPRDIDPNIKNIDGVKLFKLDDLEQIASENYEKRLSAIKHAEEFIHEDTEKYLLWLKKNTTRLCLI